MARYIVAGPPCAGKSTYVRKHFKQGDLIFDYDTLHGALSGQESHKHLDVIKPFVFAARDAVFNLLEKRKDQGCWLITSTKSSAELKAMRERFGADVVFIAVNREEAHRRANLDRRPAEWHEYIDRWFDENDHEPDEYKNKKQAGGNMETKKLLSTGVKSLDGAGELMAVFCTLEVLDLDGDVIKRGAIQPTDVKLAAFGHKWNSLPIGKGKIYERGKEAIFEGQIFTNTVDGKETYETLKSLGDLAEFSFGFDILESRSGSWQGKPCRELLKLKIFEVSPVFMGAGIDTRILSIKSSGGGGLKDPVSVLASIKALEDDLKNGPIEAMMELAKIDMLLKDDLQPERISRVSADPRAAIEQIKAVAPPTRWGLICSQIKQRDPEAGAEMVRAQAEGVVRAYAEELYRQQELSAGMPNMNACMEQAQEWANGYID